MFAWSSISLPKASDQTNEDAVFVDASGDTLVAAIADGLGGKPRGEVASAIAVEAVKQRWVESAALSTDLFADVVDAIKKMEEGAKETGMGTTLSALSMNPSQLRIFHVGDCEIVHIRGLGIKRLTTSQNKAAELVEEGIISRTAAKVHPYRFILTSALSGKAKYDPLCRDFDIEAGDRILMYSDGVSGSVHLRELLDLSFHTNDVRLLSDKVSNLIVDRGPKDDFSFISIEVM